MSIRYFKQKRVRTRIAVLSTLALLLALTLALTAAAQETHAPLAPSSSTSEFRLYLPVLRTPLPPYALQFDGLDDFASIADQGDFDFDQAFTVEAWVKPLSIRPYDDTVEEVGVVWAAPSQPPIPWNDCRGWGFLLDYWEEENGFNSPYFWVCCKDGRRLGQNLGHNLEAGRWYHWAGTYEPGQLRSYHDGELQSSFWKEAMNISEVSFLLLGMKEGAFHGLIDEVRVWNLTRSPEQIQANWNRSLRGDEPGLVGYWRLDEGSGQAIMDASPRQNDGHLGSTTGPDQNDPVWVVSDAPIQ